MPGPEDPAPVIIATLLLSQYNVGRLEYFFMESVVKFDVYCKNVQSRFDLNKQLGTINGK